MGWVPIAVTAWVLFSACIAVVVGRAIHLADQDRNRVPWGRVSVSDVIPLPTSPVARAGRGSGLRIGPAAGLPPDRRR
jgi:hypothetical protein